MGEINIHAPQPQESEGPWSVTEKGKLLCNGKEYAVQRQHASVFSRISSLAASCLGNKPYDLKAVAKYLNEKNIEETAGSFGIKLDTGATVAVRQKTYEDFVDDFIASLKKQVWIFNSSSMKKNIIENNKLDLDYFSLEYVPSEIGNLTKLTHLDLFKNKLTSLPPEIGKLSNLTSLGACANNLRSLPSEIGHLTELKYLNVSANWLRSLPREIGKLTKLQTLKIEENCLTYIPHEVGDLTELEELDAMNNKLISIPQEFGKLTKLRSLWLAYNSLTVLPNEVANMNNLTLLELNRCPIAVQGDETSMGRQELEAHFRDRVILSNEPIEEMDANTTKEEVYQILDSQPVRINRQALKAAKMPEIPGTTIEDGAIFLEEFDKVVKKINFADEQSPGYISYELLSNDFSESIQQDKNREMVYQKVIPRLTGYFKTLYEMPLEENESTGWQMYDDKVPALKKALSYIIKEFNASGDAEQLSSPFIQFVGGMLHCPTGQKEAIDTVVASLLEQKTERHSDLPAILKSAIATKKSAFFKRAILTKASSNTQNVHLISTYEGRLQNELGLSNVLGYEERMGIFGEDPFNDNPANVLKLFYDFVTPDRMASWLLEKAPSKEELQKKITLRELEKKRDAAQSVSSNPALEKMVKNLEATLETAKDDEKAEIQAKLTNLNRMLQAQRPKSTLSAEERKQLQADISSLTTEIQIADKVKPITTTLITDYLIDNKMVDPQQENWWQDYFSADPTAEADAVLSHAGAIKLLTQLGYILSS